MLIRRLTLLEKNPNEPLERRSVGALAGAQPAHVRFVPGAAGHGLYAAQMEGATPFMIGLAVGYGLTRASFRSPSALCRTGLAANL